ncbi:MAG TPA: sigma-54 dependent transcriptional regulator [Candidatus Acidoferrales bacterium]|nr:sigma-54 dependent transcriptional regulator [Candidatus Acidoferrales bacterium]
MTPGSTKPRIGIVDDDESLRERIVSSMHSDFEMLEGADYEGAYRLLQESELDVLLLALPIASGGVKECTELLARLDGSEIDTLVIVLSGDEKKATALKVIDAGAYDYFIKPVDADVLRALVGRAVEKLRIQRENRILREEVQRKSGLGNLLGSTEAMNHVFESIKRVARSNSTVIVRGESGTGKELVARSIHEHSPRKSRPFISVNCAALPESLMEAELFGYEKGAFTGAVATKEGRIELAHQGTLFLDEIATLTPALQSKLLRVLEDHALTRLGGKKAIRVDFRLISATNEDLEEMVHQDRFRQDLYYRIHVVPIFLPPLRERIDDIPLLADYFVQVYCTANQLPKKRVADDALAALKKYPWPGNVRELENVVQRLVLMSDSESIELADLPADVAQSADRSGRGRFRLPAAGIKLSDEIEAYEKKLVETALQQSSRDKTGAAKLLGVDRNRINYLTRKHGL